MFNLPEPAGRTLRRLHAYAGEGARGRSLAHSEPGAVLPPPHYTISTPSLQPLPALLRFSLKERPASVLAVPTAATTHGHSLASIPRARVWTSRISTVSFLLHFSLERLFPIKDPRR